MGKVALLSVVIAALSIVVIIQSIIILRLKRKYRRFQKEVDMERRINYSHFDWKKKLWFKFGAFLLQIKLFSLIYLTQTGVLFAECRNSLQENSFRL